MALTYYRVRNMDMYNYNPVTEDISIVLPSDVNIKARNGFESNNANCINSYIPESVLVAGIRTWYLYCSYCDYSNYRVSLPHTSSSGTVTNVFYYQYQTLGDGLLYRFHSIDGVNWVADGTGDYWKGEAGAETPALIFGYYPIPIKILPRKIIQATTVDLY